MSTRCRTCDESFLGVQEYGVHKRDSANHDYCWHCNEDFGSPAQLEEHYVESFRHAFCQYCKEQFRHQQSLENHWADCHHWCASHRKFFPDDGDMQEHNDENSDHPFCEACGHCCSETDIYEHYDNTRHPECTDCDRLFTTEALLSTHMTIDHNHCAPCNLFFRSLSHLDAHFASRRHQPALVTCPGYDCARTFNKASDLLHHFESGTFTLARSTLFAYAHTPYPTISAASNPNIIAGQGFYNLAAHLPSGTPIIWGVNVGGNNLTAAYLATVAICEAFTSSAMKDAQVTLQATEIGNEPNFFYLHSLRNESYNISSYVPEWITFATNVTKTVNSLLGEDVAIQGLSFAESSFTASGFSPEAAFNLGILNSDAGSQIKWISQHHYSGSFCYGSESLLQNLMDKTSIRGNISGFSLDISAAHALSLPYVSGETNSYSCHGAPGVSDSAGASLWALYILSSAMAGIERVYFHEGIGYKYSFIQPVTLTLSTYDGSDLPSPLPPHILPTYYAAVIATEAIGTSGATTISELTLNNSQLSGYAFYEGKALKRALFIDLVAYLVLFSACYLLNRPPFFASEALLKTHMTLDHNHCT